VVVEEEPDRIHHHRHQGPYPDGGEGGGAKKVGTGPSTSPRSAVVEACVEHTENMTLGEERSSTTPERSSPFLQRREHRPWLWCRWRFEFLSCDYLRDIFCKQIISM
jgi:hypothetical protein